MAGNARALRAASLGQAPPLVDVGRTRELMPAASSGQGHVRAGRGLPTPCRRGDRLHVSQPRIDSRGWRYRQRQVKSGHAVPEPNGGPPCPTGGKPSVDGPGSSPGKVAVGSRC